MTAVPNAKFTPGFQAEQIALKSIPGKPVNSQYQGEQIMFILTDNRRWFADPVIAHRLDKMRIQPGEVFEVQKVSRREGNKAITELEITTVVPEVTEPTRKPAGVAASSGAGESSATHLTRCYKDAVDIVAEAVLYARSKGLTLAPNFEDVRCLAATMAIAESRRAA